MWTMNVHSPLRSALVQPPTFNAASLSRPSQELDFALLKIGRFHFHRHSLFVVLHCGLQGAQGSRLEGPSLPCPPLTPSPASHRRKPPHLLQQWDLPSLPRGVHHTPSFVVHVLLPDPYVVSPCEMWTSGPELLRTRHVTQLDPLPQIHMTPLCTSSPGNQVARWSLQIVPQW